jgi:hypothetical protein
MVSEPVWTACIINTSAQSLWLYMYSPIVVRQQVLKNVTVTTKYTFNSRRIVGRFVFYAVRVISKQNRQLIHPRTSCCDVCASIRKSSYLLFADDLKMYHNITKVEGCKLLHCDIDSIQAWCFDNGKKINSYKTIIICFTHKLAVTVTLTINHVIN